jgi:uncharacterized protein (TIGR02757 family)
MKKNISEIKYFLDENYLKYNSSSFIENDPVSIPHLFSKKEDIEISAFFASTIAWGNRKSIISNANKLINLMDNVPFDFILNHSKKELKPFEKFVHRTFNGIDCIFFIESLKNIYKNKKGLEMAFSITEENNVRERIINFRKTFLETKHLSRSEKHLSNPGSNSSSKRLCMFLRWMVRQDKKGVDFGIWKSISPKELCLPLDVHTGNVSRSLGLLKRTQNDWKAVEEITGVLKTMDENDPVKYDFALFGLGVDGFLKK